ncbi:sigma-70 family RNA polymerase sigma factor [Luteolibacter marinus]|uniref:sigma-70 family RNA polymerase sigma factor n=1 Tax=Luteolibacter marinus TaxID=2776705 RepID=UPI001867499E|nr:sigma-70 family RNA polymerase sigma factor [Luteolibacter marinus]
MSSQLPEHPRKPSPARIDFDEVVRDQHSSLRFFIRSLGVNHAWVDDLAQEVFLVAYRKWSDLDHPDNARPWLRRIARNVVMNELSKTGRRQRLLDENLTSLLLEATPVHLEPGGLQDAELRHEALRHCLEKLTDRTRKIIDARYFRDRNASEIGEDLEMSAVAVRKTLFTARKSLAECLATRQVREAT